MNDFARHDVDGEIKPGSRIPMHSDAKFSPCGNYRYVLRRTWDTDLPLLGIIGLNPSTADATHNDPTVGKCIKLARCWGYGGLILVNLFAWRSKDRSQIRAVVDPVGPENDQECQTAFADVADVLLAWGNDGVFRDRSLQMRALLSKLAKNCLCLKQNLSGEPAHPLYQKDDSMKQSFLL